MNTEIDISNVTLHTGRMILRPWRQTDLDDLYAYASVDGVGQMAGWKPHESKEESQIILDMFIGHKKTFALEYQGKVIGSLGIEQYNEDHFPEFADKKCREIGYVLSKEYWGQGLMPEAVKEVIRYLFEEVGLDVIFCGHFLWNKQSQRVQEKCGFKHYAFDTYETKVDTTEEDEVNILTREDWQTASIVIRDYTTFDRSEIMNLYTSTQSHVRPSISPILREQQNARFNASVSLGSSQTFNARNRTSEVQISRFCGSYSGSVTFSAGFRSTSSHFFAWLKQLRMILLMSRIVPGVTSRPSWVFLFVETALVF